ncbi:MAG: gliding motility-associated C-terminal domain-containing protein [Saprospiraceae bacterium]|nr:gliding motility-associated C-terminal domain-containing protein [Candidatus Vicinibacter affinis]
MKSTIFIFLLFGLIQFSVQAQICADAGKDSTVCGYTYDLFGAPAGGYWTAICNKDGQLVKMDSIFPGTSRVTVTGCGTYQFVYHVDFPPCISTDTVSLNFENRSFKLQEVEYNISLQYPNMSCHPSPDDSCGNIRTLNGLIAPSPIWKINMTGRCELFEVRQTLGGIDSSNCTIQSVSQDVKITRDTSKLNWSTNQQAFLTLDANGKVTSNRFNAFLSLITQALIDDMNQKCKLEKCFVDNSLCKDTFTIDTIRTLIPVHNGGNWYFKNGNNFIRLGNSNLITLNQNEFYLNITPDAKYYGTDKISFELLSVNGNGDPIDLQTRERMIVQWREEWTYDTVDVYVYREISEDNCACNGTTTYSGDIILPVVPTFSCPEIKMVFAPTLKVKIQGKDYFCQGDITDLDGGLGYKTYQWNNGITEHATSYQRSGPAILTVSDSFNCFASDTLNLREIPAPSFTISAARNVLCRGECTELKLTVDSTYLVIWNQQDTARDLIVCPNVTKKYTATIVSPEGCRTDTFLNIQVFNAPDPRLGLDQKLTCSMNSITLDPARPDVGDKRGFYWEGPGITFLNKTSLNPVISFPGMYIFTVFDSLSGCVGRDTMEVFDDRILPVAKAGNDMILNCLNTMVQLMGDSSQTGVGYNFEWSGPSITPLKKFQINPFVDLPGTYVIKITNILNDCFTLDTVIVTQNILYPVADAGLDRVIPCDSLGLTLGGKTTSVGSVIDLVWTGPGIDSLMKNSRFPFVKLPGKYQIIVTNNVSHCQDTDEVIISLPDSLPKLSLIKSSDLDCEHDTVLIDAGKSTGKNLKYFWSGPGVNNDNRNKKSITTDLEGKYYVLIRDTLYNCEAFDSIEVFNNGGRPLVNAGLNKNITCDFTTVTLDGSYALADSVSSFTWRGPGINASNENNKKPTVSIDGVYILKVKDLRTGCVAEDSVLVNKLFVKPVPFLGPDRTLNCRKDTLDITAQLTNMKTAYSFVWTGPNINAGNERNVRQIIRTPGVYNGFITTPNPECNTSDTLVISIDTMRYNINAPDTAYFSCNNRIYNFSVNDFSPFDSIVWADVFNRRVPSPDLGRSVSFLFEGEYRYLTYQKNGCFTSGMVIVKPYTTIVVDKIEVKASCPSDPTGSIRVFIKQGDKPVTFSIEGSARDTTSYFSPLPPAPYMIRIYDRYNCFLDTVVGVPELQGLPTFLNNGMEEFLICKDTTIDIRDTLIANKFPPDQASYEWRRGSTKISDQPVITIDAPDVYSVLIINKNGCDSILIRYDINQDESLAEKKVQLPNVFTPNGDNENDKFRPVFDPKTEFEMDGYSLKIFNRWGHIVFESADPQESWDGTYKGDQAPVETYIVVFSGRLDLCGSMREVSLKSTLNLIR